MKPDVLRYYYFFFYPNNCVDIMNDFNIVCPKLKPQTYYVSTKNYN